MARTTIRTTIMHLAKPNKSADPRSYPTYCGKLVPITRTLGRWPTPYVPICADCADAADREEN